jgi:hypothetical protein
LTIAKNYTQPGDVVTGIIEFPEEILRIIAEKGEITKDWIKRSQNILPFLAATWSTTMEELRFLYNDYLCDTNYFFNLNSLQITSKGWAHIENLKKINSESDYAFVAMWFDDGFFHETYPAIEKAVNRAGYKCEVLKVKEHNNNINDEIIARIKQSKFVISDFTDQRHNVYFESGYAKGLGLEVIWTCKKDSYNELKFDTKHYNFIQWENDKLPKFENDLYNRVIASPIGKGPFDPKEFLRPKKK